VGRSASALANQTNAVAGSINWQNCQNPWVSLPWKLVTCYWRIECGFGSVLETTTHSQDYTADRDNLWEEF
jgi:hypothetical protein